MANRVVAITVNQNTSFNTDDEPIVCTPSDAIRTFVRTDLDALVIGGFVLEKPNRDRTAAADHK